MIVWEALEGKLIDLMEQITADFPESTLFSLPSFGTDTQRRHVELGMKGPAGRVAEAMARITAELTRRGYEWEPRAAL